MSLVLGMAWYRCAICSGMAYRLNDAAASPPPSCPSPWCWCPPATACWASTLPHRRPQVRRRGAPGRLRCRWWCPRPSLRRDRTAGPGRRRAADRLAVQRAPSHFGEDVHDPSLPLDPARDAWTLPLIPPGAGARHAAAGHLPRHAGGQRRAGRFAAPGGARGGAVRRPPRPATSPAAVQYAPAHPVEVLPGGWLAHRRAARFQVNSVHGQAVNRLAPGLRVEAVAPDGLVEAFSVDRRRASTCACSGTPNGRRPTTRCRCSCCRPSAWPARLPRPCATAPCPPHDPSPRVAQPRARRRLPPDGAAAGA
jgi:hypothetical protein